MSVTRVVNSKCEDGERDFGTLIIQADLDLSITFGCEVFDRFHKLVLRHVSRDDMHWLLMSLHRDVTVGGMSHGLDVLNDLLKVRKNPFKVVDTMSRNHGIWWIPTKIVD